MSTVITLKGLSPSGDEVKVFVEGVRVSLIMISGAGTAAMKMICIDNRVFDGPDDHQGHFSDEVHQPVEDIPPLSGDLSGQNLADKI